MSSLAGKNELSDLVEPLPIPGGWAWSYYHGYKNHSELLKSSRWSIGFGCTWGDITSWYNSGALEKKEKYLVGIAAEFFLRVYYLFFRIRPLQDYKTLEIPTQISENQKKRCEQIEQGVRKHLQQGNDKIYSDACPIRLWTSILKYHKEAPEFMKAFMRECDTRNGKRQYESEGLLAPSDYDHDSPYELSTCDLFCKIGDINPTNGLHPLTKEEVLARKNNSNNSQPSTRQSNQPAFAQPRRSSIGGTVRPTDPSIHSRSADTGMAGMREKATSSSQRQNFTPHFGPAKRFRIEDTPPQQPQKARKLVFE